MPAPLEAFLHYITSGNEILTPEMYQHFGGDDILKELKKYDPGVKWVEADIGGGEGATSTPGMKLEWSDGQMHVPTPKSGGDFLSLRPSNFTKEPLRDPTAITEDENYGTTTDASNVTHKSEGIEKYAPLIAAAISMGAPIGAGLLAAGGIGGAAGLTAAATGSGLTGVNTFGLTPWMTQGLKALPNIAGQISNGSFNPMSLASLAGSALGIDPKLMSAGTTLANLAKLYYTSQQRKP